MRTKTPRGFPIPAPHIVFRCSTPTLHFSGREVSRGGGAKAKGRKDFLRPGAWCGRSERLVLPLYPGGVD